MYLIKTDMNDFVIISGCFFVHILRRNDIFRSGNRIDGTNSPDDETARPEFATCEMMADFFHVTLAYLLGSSDDRVPDTIDIDLDEQELQGVCEDYREMFQKYVRLCEKSKAIVDAAINGAFQADMNADDLLEDNRFLIQVMDRATFERRIRDKESGNS